MASGIRRSPWLPRMASELGWTRGKLYALFRKNGYASPYLDEQRALRILAKHNIPLPGNGATLPVSPSKTPRGGSDPMQGAPENKKGVSPEALQKIRLAWSKKLVPRLARLLPEGDTQAGKQRVRKILREGGYEGPRWDDEARALAVLRAAGVSTDNFEYASNGAVSAAAQERPVQLSFVPRQPPNIETVDRDAAKRLQLVFSLLNAYEHKIMELIRNGHLSKLSSPLEMPIAALNELRAHMKVH